MALSLGSALATRVYLGATEINLAYFGATQVYSSSAFSAEAQNYFDRLDTAGDTTYVDYKLPLANYIDGLVTNGLWNGLLSAACFVGVGIQGMLVPLKSGMATITNSGFLAGDLDQLNGLKGDASSHIGTGVTKGDLTQNDLSMSVYLTQAGTVSNVQAFIGALAAGLLQLNSSSSLARVAASGGAFTDTDRGTGFYGGSRDNSAEIDVRFKGSDYTVTETSIAVSGTDELSVFARAGSGLFSDWGIGTYHIGTSVGAAGLITLETLQATLITEVAEASFSTEAANYFARLAVAGDTTHYAYRQPLANYIDGLVTLGGAYWDDMVSAASFVGVGIQGVTVPLRAGMASLTNVNNNFVAADLNQLTGLKGNASTKYIDTNIAGTSLAQDDASASVYITEPDTVNFGYYMGNGTNTTAGACMMVTATNQNYVTINGVSQQNTSTTIAGFNGMSRDNSSNFDYKDSVLTNYTKTSAAPISAEIFLYARNSSGTAAQFAQARFATYHFGPALDLATLEGLQATLMSEVSGAAAEIAAFAAESGATDLNGLTNLVTYLKQESLYDDFVIYPMKSAQNAGSGSTVYSLGGITTNNMTLVNSPTWGASGLAFNGTTQAGRVSDYTGSGSVTLFARVSNQTEPASTAGDGIWGQWDNGANGRSAAIFSYGTSQAAGTSQLALLRSANGATADIYLEDRAPNWATDSCRVAEWTDAGGRKAWLDKAEETLSLVIGSAQTSRFNSAVDSTFASQLTSGSLSGFSALTGIAAASYEGVLTTTQRETITDYINAL